MHTEMVVILSVLYFGSYFVLFVMMFSTSKHSDMKYQILQNYFMWLL